MVAMDEKAVSVSVLPPSIRIVGPEPDSKSPPPKMKKIAHGLRSLKSLAELHGGSLTTIHLGLWKTSWAAHQLAAFAADVIFHIVAVTIATTFIALSPKDRSICHGYLTPHQIGIRLACNSLVAGAFNLAALAAEERITGVRFEEVMDWLPSLPWFSQAMTVMLAIAGGVGPLVSVDAGLFGHNECYPNNP
ncbi:hypothetical protein HK104_001407 [Borealophlyctis nickersoniae]|nr:hypothetical protein HK104_001407 [Borealophlyctis nickersoniae]